MLICEKFVVLNMPKTGSTFVRTAVTEIYRRRAHVGSSSIPPRDVVAAGQFYRELILPNINVPGRPHDQHGTYRQIPEEDRHKIVMSVIRDPFEKFLSTYQFRWWAKYPPLGLDEAIRHFPHFPDLGLDDYVRLNILSGQRKLPNGNPLEIGNQTIQFIRMYFRDPIGVLGNLSYEYIESDSRFRSDMAEIVFLRQDNLNEELANFLSNVGFTTEEVEYCRSLPRINVTNCGTEDRKALWTESSLRYVRWNERFLFRMLRALGLTFETPRCFSGSNPGLLPP